jgi:hypothetical protein
MSAKYVRKGADDDETPGLSGRRERSSVNSCRSKQPKRTLRLFVQPFARAFFDHMNLRAGSYAEIFGYTEPVFKRQLDGITCRPDGLIVLDTGKRERRLLVETKIGAGRLCFQ